MLIRKLQYEKIFSVGGNGKKKEVKDFLEKLGFKSQAKLGMKYPCLWQIAKEIYISAITACIHFT